MELKIRKVLIHFQSWSTKTLMRPFFPAYPEKGIYYILYEEKGGGGKETDIKERVEVGKDGNYFYKSAVGKLESSSLSYLSMLS